MNPDSVNRITGGSAFPVADVSSIHRIGSAAISGVTDPAERDRVYIDATAKAALGMTLRDYFAAKALVGALGIQSFADGFEFSEKAAWVYAMADAMLEARK